MYADCASRDREPLPSVRPAHSLYTHFIYMAAIIVE